MTDPTLEEIKARAEAATPGPWKVIAIPAAESELATPGGENVEHVDLFRECIPMIPAEGHRPAEGINVFSADMASAAAENIACLVNVAYGEPDVEFIAHARTDVPYLLERIERAERERDRGAQVALEEIAKLEAKFVARIRRLEEVLQGLRRTHLVVDDCWYSCPKAVDDVYGDSACCDDSKRESICTCGAEKHNAAIDAVLST
jgi:hypothetical protein